MIVGILEFQLRLFSPNSLKDKRRIIKSLISRMHNKFNVSIAEIGDYSLWQRASLGLDFLSSDTNYSNKTLDKILEFLGREREFFVIDFKKEIL